MSSTIQLKRASTVAVADTKLGANRLAAGELLYIKNDNIIIVGDGTSTVAQLKAANKYFMSPSAANLTGTPTAPTVATTDNSTNIATTAFVKNVVGTLDVGQTSVSSNQTISTISETDGKISVSTQNISLPFGQISGAGPSNDTPIVNGTGSAGTSNNWSRKDHVHPSDTSKADKSTTVTNVAWDSANSKITKTINGITTEAVSASTLKSAMALNNVTNESKATMFANAALTGTPTAPTAAASTNSTQIATTAFVQSVVTANKSLYFQSTQPSVGSGILAIWVNSSNNTMYIHDNDDKWHIVGAVWAAN